MGKTQELREAYIAGARRMLEEGLCQSPGPYFGETWQERAAEIYLTPTETRPRIIDIPNDGQYRIVNGAIEYRYDADDEWGTSWFDAERVAALAELLANPTETVEVDDA